jgi:hypothetical protein
MSEHYGIYEKGWVKNISEMKRAIVGCCLKQALAIQEGKPVSKVDEFNGYIRSTSTRYNEYKVYDSVEEARSEVRMSAGPHEPIYWVGPCNSEGYYIVHKADFSNPKYFYKWMTIDEITTEVANKAYGIYVNFMKNNGSLN